jgi:hypothetical protein
VAQLMKQNPRSENKISPNQFGTVHQHISEQLEQKPEYPTSSVKVKFPVPVLNALVLQCMFADDLLADSLIIRLSKVFNLEELPMFVEQIAKDVENLSTSTGYQMLEMNPSKEF